MRTKRRMAGWSFRSTAAASLDLTIDSSFDLSSRSCCFWSEAEEEGNWESIWRKEWTEAAAEA